MSTKIEGLTRPGLDLEDASGFSSINQSDSGSAAAGKTPAHGTTILRTLTSTFVTITIAGKSEAHMLLRRSYNH
eukprot:g80555.t1